VFAIIAWFRPTQRKAIGAEGRKPAFAKAIMFDRGRGARPIAFVRIIDPEDRSWNESDT
jgi:hypothetical protein